MMDEISKLSNNVKVLVISCLTNIIAKIASTTEAKVGIERAMNMLGSSFHELNLQRQGRIRILIAPCTPRKSKDFSTHNKFALVCMLLLLNHNLSESDFDHF
jgi:hypothetical protein